METTEPRRARKDVQAKNIPDREVLALLHATRATSTADLQEYLAYPPKVVVAKLRALTRRGLAVADEEMRYTLTAAGAEALAGLLRAS